MYIYAYTYNLSYDTCTHLGKCIHIYIILSLSLSLSLNIYIYIYIKVVKRTESDQPTKVSPTGS